MDVSVFGKSGVWITGPSGSGKSWILGQVRELDINLGTLDLDFLGYRKSGDWKDWSISRMAFDLVRDLSRCSHRPYVAAGCDKDPMTMAKLAVESGFKIVVITPSPEVLKELRKKRGDKPEKVATSLIDVSNWQSWYDKFSSVYGDSTVFTYESSFEVLNVLKGK